MSLRAAMNSTSHAGYARFVFPGFPKMAGVLGHFTRSWPRRADLTGRFLCRLFTHMGQHGWDACTPVLADPRVQPRPWMDLSSGYVQRALGRLPRQGTRSPWTLQPNYLLSPINI